MKRYFPWILLILLVPSLARAAESVAAAIGDRVPTAILGVMPSDTPPGQRLPDLVFVAGYEVVGQPVPLDAAQAARLLAAVKAPGAFDSAEPEQKMMPAIAYRFGTAPDAVDLLVCFGCDKVAIVPSGADAIAGTQHLTQPARDALLGLAKELLPKDEAIQELPKVRSEKPAPPPAVPIPQDAPRAGQPPAR